MSQVSAEDGESDDARTEIELVELVEVAGTPSDEMVAAMADLVNGLRPNTRRAYHRDLVDYLDWCQHANRAWDEPTSIAGYLRELHHHGSAASTIARRVPAIHKLWEIKQVASGDPELWDPTKHPIVKNALKAIRQDLGGDQDKAAPLTGNDMVQLLSSINADTSAGLRDRALLLVGWYGALRVSELLAIRRPDLAFDGDNGVIVTLGRTKGDNQQVPVAITANPSSRWDPVRHVRTWLEHLEQTSEGFASDVVWARTLKGGGIRRPASPITSPKSIYTLVTNRARNAGLKNLNCRGPGYSPHSLRAGFITEAKNRGVDEADIMRHTRHKSISVMRGYDRNTRHWHRNASDFTL